jgi:hypothetical protein
VLSVTRTDSRKDAVAQIGVWKTEAAKVPALEAQITEAAKVGRRAEVLGIVEKLVAEGKMWPSEKDGYVELGIESPKVFDRQVALRTAVIVPREQKKPEGDGAAGGGGAGGAPQDTGIAGLSAEELMVCHKRGTDPIKYLANKKLEAKWGGLVAVTKAQALQAGLTADEMLAAGIE